MENFFPFPYHLGLSLGFLHLDSNLLSEIRLLLGTRGWSHVRHDFLPFESLRYLGYLFLLYLYQYLVDFLEMPVGSLESDSASGSVRRFSPS